LVNRDGRPIGFAEFGDPNGTAVVWCHGGPGSRLEPAWLHAPAAAAGLRLIGFDRPGYGLSPPVPGRSFGDVVDDALAVADDLGLERFATVGVSTGGAYALAIAAAASARVVAVVAACSVTDMSWGPGRATMSPAHALAVWDAPDRDSAIAAATEAHGVGGSKLTGGALAAVLSPSDQEMFLDPAWAAPAMEGFADMFKFGLEGYADDRIADGPGWGQLDLTAIRCPVVVLHGTDDRMCDVIHARHTARIVTGAQLVEVEGLGHFSIERHIIPELVRILGLDANE